MPGETISPNMNLILPGVGVTLGPQWATDLNSSLNIIDGHDHASGSGVPINPAGLDISSDLTIKNNNLTNARSLRMAVQPSALALASDLGCLYVTGVDLYFNDENGNQIQITQSGGVAGSPGSISNLTSPASASYVAGSQTFVWQSGVSTAANMDAGSLILRNITPSSFGITLSPPTLSSNYSIVLPALPASTKIMSIDSSGNIGAVYGVDESTLTISANVIQVKSGGITATQLSTDAVSTVKIQDGAVTRPKLAAVGQQVSSSSGSFSTASGSLVDVTNLNVTITTSGRPVMLMLQSSGGSTLGTVGVDGTSGVALAPIEILRASSPIYVTRLGIDNGVATGLNTAVYPPSIIHFMDTPAAGTYTYKIQTALISGGAVRFTECVLVAYEL